MDAWGDWESESCVGTGSGRGGSEEETALSGTGELVRARADACRRESGLDCAAVASVPAGLSWRLDRRPPDFGCVCPAAGGEEEVDGGGRLELDEP